MNTISDVQFVGYWRFDLASHLGFQKFAFWKMTSTERGQAGVIAFGPWSEGLVSSEPVFRRFLEPDERLTRRYLLFPEHDVFWYSRWFGSWVGSTIGPFDREMCKQKSWQEMEQRIRLSVIGLLRVPVTSLGELVFTPHLAVPPGVEVPAVDRELVTELEKDSHDGVG